MYILGSNLKSSKLTLLSNKLLMSQVSPAAGFTLTDKVLKKTPLSSVNLYSPVKSYKPVHSITFLSSLDTVHFTFWLRS